MFRKPRYLVPSPFHLPAIISGLLLFSLAYASDSDGICNSDDDATCSALAAHEHPHLTSTRDVMQELLGGPDAAEEFFDAHFEKEPLHIDDATRNDRVAWMKTYRRFLKNEDLDALLSANASASVEGAPLQIGLDVDLVRVAEVADGVWGRKRIASLFPKLHPPNLAVDLRMVHELFQEGFELVVYNMELRAAAVTPFVTALEAFWMVDATSQLHFLPAKTNVVSRKAPLFFAEDVFIVQLDGELDVTLFADMFPFPSLQHVDDPAVLQSAHDGLAESDKSPMEIHLDEGDTLYIPRGWGVDARTAHKISLHITFALSTHQLTIREGLLASIDAVRTREMENPLDIPLAGERDQEGFSSTWLDLLHTAVHVASEYTPDMRRFLHVGSAVSSAIEEAGGISALQLLERQLQNFVRAASDALFDPMLELLMEDDENLKYIATEDVIRWARKLGKRAKRSAAGKVRRKQVEEMFKKCLREIEDCRSSPEDGVTGISLAYYKTRLISRERKEKFRDAVLARHGESHVNVTNEFHLTDCEDLDADGTCKV